MDSILDRRLVYYFGISMRFVDKSWILCRAEHAWPLDGWIYREYMTLENVTGDFSLTFPQPDPVLYLTYWYKSNELPTRLAWFWTVLSSYNI